MKDSNVQDFEEGNEDSYDNDHIEMSNHKLENSNETHEILEDNWKLVETEYSYWEINGPVSKINLENEILKSPISLFLQIFTDELFTKIVDETNNYFRQEAAKIHISNRMSNWEDVTVSEMKSFVGIILLMGIIKRESMYDHWSDEEILQSIVATKIP